MTPSVRLVAGAALVKCLDTMAIPGDIIMTLHQDHGMIEQKYDPFPNWYPLLQDQPMVRINDAWFIPAIVSDGKVREMGAKGAHAPK